MVGLSNVGYAYSLYFREVWEFYIIHSYYEVLLQYNVLFSFYDS